MKQFGVGRAHLQSLVAQTICDQQRNNQPAAPPRAFPSVELIMSTLPAISKNSSVPLKNKRHFVSYLTLELA